MRTNENEVAKMGEMSYNYTSSNHIKSSGALERHRYPFSTCGRGARTMNHSTRIPYFPANLQDYAPWVATHGLVAPYGECQCGCRQLAPIAKETNKRHGHTKDKPTRFIHNHHHNVGPSLAERFWEKVDKRDPDECWEWTGSRNGAGYGKIGIGMNRDYAHRVSYELHFGPIPDGLFACHHCDNPPCVNPAHLFVGTAQENTQDMLVKGRCKSVEYKGSSNPNAKFTEDQVRCIRQRRANGETYASLAREFGVLIGTIYKIVKRERWGHVV